MQRVHIEFQRVQTWLFAVPRLRAMVGANTLLGETLRVKLPHLARQNGRWSLAQIASHKDYPAAKPKDPLKDYDDPQKDAKYGILSRDGGHFEAQFASGAETFAEAARSLIQEQLPGLRYSITVDHQELPKRQAYLSTELPVLAPCEWTGRGLASAIIQQGDERSAVSLDIKRRHEAAQRSEQGKAQDLASLLIAQTKLKHLQRPQDLDELVSTGYLALIQADGNGIGSAVAGKSEAERAEFFHYNRVLLRRALRKAINEHCPAEGTAPLIPLMLGGDDLLVICRAEIALPFVVTLCQKLDEFQSGQDNYNLTLGIGVVIANSTVPIYRLHEVVEQLVSSAKRRVRGLVASNQLARSVVDWAVYTTAWADDPANVRRRDWICGGAVQRRILSQRPVDVLGDKLSTLQGLVGGAQKLYPTKDSLNSRQVPRSQLRYLVDQLPKGRTQAELAWKELSPKARDALKAAGVCEIWKQTNDGTLLTELLDLVEIAEISLLGVKERR